MKRFSPGHAPGPSAKTFPYVKPMAERTKAGHETPHIFGCSVDAVTRRAGSDRPLTVGVQSRRARARKEPPPRHPAVVRVDLLLPRPLRRRLRRTRLER